MHSIAVLEVIGLGGHLVVVEAANQLVPVEVLRAPSWGQVYKVAAILRHLNEAKLGETHKD